MNIVNSPQRNSLYTQITYTFTSSIAQNLTPIASFLPPIIYRTICISCIQQYECDLSAAFLRSRQKPTKYLPHYSSHDGIMRSAKYARDAISDRVSLYSSASRVSVSGVMPLRRKYTDNGIASTSTDNSQSSILECVPLETDGKGNFVDSLGRKTTLRGINVDGAMKLPVEPAMTSYEGDSSDENNIFFDGNNVSFVGRPFPLEEAELHFQRIKSWGFNTIRYLLTWEAIEHAGPDVYDDDFVDYTIKILEIIHKVGGLYVFLEMHQDVWSRFSGGSGAPMWTYYAVGLEPKRFTATEAAIFHNEPRFHSDDPDHYHKMFWVSNYKRLAPLVMFTLFFSGKIYFPDLIINNVNIQDYLQDHYHNALKYVWEAVNERLPSMILDGTILGFELMNEPNMGLVGHASLDVIPMTQQLRVGTTPTIFQCMKLGMGFPCEIDEYRITLTGPQCYGKKLIDPKGLRAWISPEEAITIDQKYGFKRDSKWKLGTCIFANVDIWSWDKTIDMHNLPYLTPQERLDISDNRCELHLPEYFNQVSNRPSLTTFHGVRPSKVDAEYFINNIFIDFYLKFKEIIRAISPNAFVFIQPPVLEIPPNIKRDSRHIIDSKTVYCPHYYDGMSLMFKGWNTKYNVDTLGIMRGRYLNPVLGIVFGERAIRNCIKKQFVEIKKECEDNLGCIPVLMSETGMPFDMDGKRAYFNGRYYSQTAALDALSNALEGAKLSHTYWCYTSINNHKWGDRWNNEDFSFWSSDDRNLEFDENDKLTNPPVEDIPIPCSRRGSLVNSLKSIKSSRRSNDASVLVKSAVSRLQGFRGFRGFQEPANTPESRTSSSETGGPLEIPPEKLMEEENAETHSVLDLSVISSTSGNVQLKHNRRCFPSPDGVRAPSAVIRPYLMATKGEIQAMEFDLRTVKFALTVSINRADYSLPEAPTIIFVPKWQYPYLNYGDIYLTSGYVKYNRLLEYMEWYHTEDADDLGETPPQRTGTVQETIIIKNNSGILPENRLREDESYFTWAGDLNCPIT